jgi:hypothetical protein
MGTNRSFERRALEEVERINAQEASSWWECGDREDHRELERWLEDKEADARTSGVMKH